MKYFPFDVFSSAFFLFGVALLYGYAGIFFCAGAAQAIITSRSPPVLLLTGLVMLVIGLLLKVDAVSFRAWTPDIYAGAPIPATSFMVIATRAATMAALPRMFYVALDGARWDRQPIIATVAVVTMVIGAMMGLMQQGIKRLLTCSLIVHAGFVLTGFVVAMGATAKDGVSSVGSISFYLLAYSFATLGGFGIITMVRRAEGEANGVAVWWGLGWTNPFVAEAMTLFLFSFAGIPLTAGFVGKLMVFVAVWQGGHGWLVLVAAIASLVAALFYPKIVVAIWFKEPERGQQGRVARASGWTWIVIAVPVVTTIALGSVPGSILSLAAGAAQFIH